MQKTILFRKKKLCYTIKGEGAPLLFVHGFCEDSRMWEVFTRAIPSGYQIICVDLPGFGQSESFAPISISEMAHATKAILDAESIEQTVWIGHSMGGYVGLVFTALFPKYLNGLCLFHSHPFADSPKKKENRKKSIDFIKKHGAICFVKELIPKLFSSEFRHLKKKVVAEFINIAKEQSKEGILAAIQAMIDRKDQQNTLKNIDLPLLSILGKKDEVIPKNLDWVTLPRSAAATIIEHAGHMGFLEAPDECRIALIAWLEGLHF